MSRPRLTLLVTALALAVGFAAFALDSHDTKLTLPAPSVQLGDAPSFAGTWTGVYHSDKVSATRVTLIFQQRGTTVTGTYLSQNGAQGVTFGVATPSGPTELTAVQTTPTCPGSFSMPATVEDGVLSWGFNGWDCLGSENGKGKAAHPGDERASD